MKPSPCLGCTERYEACHDYCKHYKDWRQAREAANAAKRLENNVVGSINRRIKEMNIKLKNRR